MKAIILAAGRGIRMDKYTKNIPKCMLNINGKTLIERQIETLRSVGINNIIIIKGYMPDKINISGVKYYVNGDYKNTNMVETLMCAEEEMNDDIIVCYGDILYEKRIIKIVMKNKSDIGVVVDENYWDYWKARSDNPEEDRESLIIDKVGKIIELGDPNCTLDEAKFRYIGLIKISKKGVRILKKLYHEYKKKYWHKDEKFLNSKSFKKLYMTDMLQLIINSGLRVDPVVIKNGWLEFDTNEDYEKVMNWVKNGSIRRFYNFDM